MTSKSALDEMTPQDRAAFGFARVRNAAFEAVQQLWRRRKADGLTQLELAARIGMAPARLSKCLSGPGNWTLRTFGELVEGLDGEAKIIVHALEDPFFDGTNYDAYSEMDDLQPNMPLPPKPKGTQGTIDQPPPVQIR